jgi:anti-anti-sigma regulatory factor
MPSTTDPHDGSRMQPGARLIPSAGSVTGAADRAPRSLHVAEVDVRTPVVVESRRMGSSTVVVATPTGVLDEDLAAHLDAVLTDRRAEAVVIDLDHCTIVNTSVLAGLDPHRWQRSATQTCIACRRPTARELLVRSGAAQRLAVFRHTEDALQALIHSGSGYGLGWELDLTAPSVPASHRRRTADHWPARPVRPIPSSGGPWAAPA